MFYTVFSKKFLLGKNKMASSVPVERQGFITFNTWTRSHTIGHVSITFGEKENDQILWQDYLSIHPKHAFLANPLIFLSTIPLKAQTVSFNEDCHLESFQEKSLRLPDYQYTFPATKEQLQKTKNYAETAKKEIDLGLNRYTYLPKLKVATKVLQATASSKRAFEEAQRDPISGLPVDFLSTRFIAPPDLNGSQNITQSHCVTQARDVATILGLPLSSERPFFVETPGQFNDELQKLASEMTGASILETAHTPSVEEKLAEVPI